MKKILYILLFFISLLFVGCSNDDNLNRQTNDFTVTLNLSFNGMEHLNINSGDKLSIYKKNSNKIVDLEYKSEVNGIYTFSAQSKQELVIGEDYTVVFPATDEPLYDNIIKLHTAIQNGSGSDEHLTKMSRFEADFNNFNQTIVVENQLATFKLNIIKPNDANGIPVQLDLITEDKEDNNINSSKSVLRLQNINNWDKDLLTYVVAIPKSASFERTITCIITTSSNVQYKQIITQNKDVVYNKCEESKLDFDNLVYVKPVFVETVQTFTITDNVKQKIFIGLDAERLWYWKDNFRDELAQLSVGDIDVKFARVAIDCGYELIKGDKKPEVYDIQLNMMRAFKAKNPNLLFFATPRPLFNSYSEVERVNLFGHKDNTPWSSVPLWVYKFNPSGTKTMSDGTIVPNYVAAGYDWDNLTTYFADYLNFMHEQGFDFDYMDLTNETETRTTPNVYKYVFDNLQSKLNPGVKMPILIAPSSWSVQGGINWMNSVTEDQRNSFGIAAVHNTGNQGGTLMQFVKLAQNMGKEPWNTELHDWVGISTKEEVLTADNFFEYFRAGFTGMSGWLFFGPANGKDHCKLWVGNKAGSHTKSAKYEIFKEVVNKTNGGNYLASTVNVDNNDIKVTSFIKDNTLSIVALNKSLKEDIVTFDLEHKNINGEIIVHEWNEKLSKAGKTFTINPITQTKFQIALGAESLYFFTIRLNNSIN